VRGDAAPGAEACGLPEVADLVELARDPHDLVIGERGEELQHVVRMAVERRIPRHVPVRDALPVNDGRVTRVGLSVAITPFVRCHAGSYHWHTIQFDDRPCRSGFMIDKVLRRAESQGSFVRR
jgi:hypothetical protein